MAFAFFETVAKKVVPPWLQRTVGAKLMGALGGQVDELAKRTTMGVQLRFPGVDFTVVDDDGRALGYIGRDRRIRRGPREAAATYAKRLQTWWDAHRIRGSTYAMLGQLFAFFVDWLPMQIDVVGQSGVRHVMDAAGAITRDSITWGGDWSGDWAHLWVFFYVSATIPIGEETLVTTSGDVITTLGGAPIVASIEIDADALTPTDEEVFTLIPREWRAAHIPYVTVVLLWDERRLWRYPQPVPTWADWGASGALWGEPPTILIAQ